MSHLSATMEMAGRCVTSPGRGRFLHGGTDVAEGTAPTEKRCSKCGEIKPLDAFAKQRSRKDGRRSHCRSCIAAQQATKKGEYAARHRRWYKNHQALIVQRSRQWRADNRERHRAYSREWQADHPEQARATQQRWYAENRERGNASKRAWTKRNRAYARAALIAYRARKRDAPGKASIEAIAARIAFYGGRCWICRSDDAREVDHVKPLTKGGSNWPANLRPICRSCNGRKGNRWFGVAGLARFREAA